MLHAKADPPGGGETDKDGDAMELAEAVNVEEICQSESKNVGVDSLGHEAAEDSGKDHPKVVTQAMVRGVLERHVPEKVIDEMVLAFAQGLSGPSCGGAKLLENEAGVSDLASVVKESFKRLLPSVDPSVTEVVAEELKQLSLEIAGPRALGDARGAKVGERGRPEPDGGNVLSERKGDVKTPADGEAKQGSRSPCDEEVDEAAEEAFRDDITEALKSLNLTGADVVSRLIAEGMKTVDTRKMTETELESFRSSVVHRARALLELRPIVVRALGHVAATSGKGIKPVLVDEVTGMLIAQNVTDVMNFEDIKFAAMQAVRTVVIGEDEPDGRLWECSAIDRAIACKVDAPNMARLGYVLSLEDGYASVLHGVNQLATIKMPEDLGGTEAARYGPGNPVFLSEKHTTYPNGVSEISYDLVRGEVELEEHHFEELPVLRAVVQNYREGMGGTLVGVALVPTTGSVVTFVATESRNPRTMPPQTVFTFCPVFEDGDVEALGPVFPNLGNVDDATIVHKPDVGVVNHLHPLTELVDGFYSPDDELQTFMRDKFGVNASPYTGSKTTTLDYYGGGELFKRMLANGVGKWSARNALEFQIREVEKYMAKISVYKNSRGADPSPGELRTKMRCELSHVAFPTEATLEVFAKYVQRQMKSATNEGNRLRLCVGVLIDECANTTCLYNTERCPFFDSKAYPWVKSFTLIEGDYVLNEYNSELNELVPAVEAIRRRKILMVELDSWSCAKGCLPVPQVIRMSSAQQGRDDSASGKEVLLGLHEHDPRVTTMIRDGGASIYKTVENTVILALAFHTEKKAQEFVAAMRESEAGVYCMTRRNMYAPHAYTLSCKRAVGANELFQMLRAVEVMPIGQNKYRFTSPHAMLTTAKILYRRNRYKKNEKDEKAKGPNKPPLNKYRCLRDDNNRYVFMDKTMPVTLSVYQRRPPLGLRGQRTLLPVNRPWYRISGLPRDQTDEQLREVLLQWDGIKEIQDWRVDRSIYDPVMYVSVLNTQEVAKVVKGVFPTTIYVLPSRSPPKTATALREKGEDFDHVQAMLRPGVAEVFVPQAMTLRYLEAYDKTPGPAPNPNSVYRLGASRSKASEGKQRSTPARTPEHKRRGPQKDGGKSAKSDDGKAGEKAEKPGRPTNENGPNRVPAHAGKGNGEKAEVQILTKGDKQLSQKGRTRKRAEIDLTKGDGEERKARLQRRRGPERPSNPNGENNLVRRRDLIKKQTPKKNRVAIQQLMTSFAIKTNK